LHIVKRKDGRGLLAHWRARLVALMGKGKPFWSSSKNRYCTSDMKRDPINRFFTLCGNFIISCEGIRAEESTGRAKKVPLKLRTSKCSEFYGYKACDVKTRKIVTVWMTVEEALAAYDGVHKLALDWYPIFNFMLDEVWATRKMYKKDLAIARQQYKQQKQVPVWWPFHPAYVYGNDRVSCMFCIMGSLNDLAVAAEHNPGLLKEMIAMEDKGGATFKNDWSLKKLL